MLSFFKWLFITLIVAFIWSGINLLSTTQGWFVEAIAAKGDRDSFVTKTLEMVKFRSKGNGVILMLENGQPVEQYAYSKDQEVSADTVFGVASLGKWIAAVGVMTLVEQGRLDLDAPVSQYLSRWQLPPSNFDEQGVTVRRLLSHTAGITDGLGHNGFEKKQDVQSLESHLTAALDADEGAQGSVEIGITPGSQFKYSGGSYNLLQLIIEEISGLTFTTYMRQSVFAPLQMNKTFYDHDLAYSKNILAQYFDSDGKERKYPYYTSLAATGLYTTANDLAKFAKWHLTGKLPNDEVLLSQTSLNLMGTPHASTMGIDIWGLGAMLFADNEDDGYIIGHGGQSPSLNATLRINSSNGDGFIMLTTGNRALASDTATYWTVWQTGNPDIYMLKNMIPDMLKRSALGSLVIFILSLLVWWRLKRKNHF